MLTSFYVNVHLQCAKTYSYKDAVEVSGFICVGVGGQRFAQDLRQAPHAGDSHDVDVNVAAESLNEREVDLKRDVILVLLIRSQDAQDYAVWITVKQQISFTMLFGFSICSYNS